MVWMFWRREEMKGEDSRRKKKEGKEKLRFPYRKLNLGLSFS
jgi:hypothetical protein